MQIVTPSVALLSHTLEPERLIELAGRVCWKSEEKITDGSHVRFIQMLLEKGHESVLEHASADFRVVCDRGVSHEFVRHRLASYSQESTRYCRYKGGIQVIEPPGLSGPMRDKWLHAIHVAESIYAMMLDNGVAPQIARSVLPTCLKTEIVVTANFREWRHIIKLRTDPAAHPQIREVVGMIRDKLHWIAPTVFPMSQEGQRA